MSHIKCLIISIILPVSLSLHAKNCESSLIDWSDSSKTTQLMSASFQKEEFILLEQALTCLMSDERKFINGNNGSIETYLFFRKIVKSTDKDPFFKIHLINWNNLIPNSKFAHFASLRLKLVIAWSARGSKYSSATKTAKLSNFKTLLRQAKQAIQADSNNLRNTAISYNLLLAVELDLNGRSENAYDILLKGVNQWPDYYRFYETWLNRTVPKWGGSWEEVDELIKTWSKSAKKIEGDSLYARLYYRVHHRNRSDPRRTRVTWIKLKASLLSLMDKYPAQEHFEIAASYACIYSDLKFYKRLTSNHELNSSVFWLRGTSKENCDDFVNSWLKKLHK